MKTAYQWGADFSFTGQVEVDEFAQLPPRTTFTAPPEQEDDKVAIWAGDSWLLKDAPADDGAAAQAALVAVYEKAVQERLDEVSRQHGYDSIYTAISYADEPAVPRFQADGQAFRRWRSLVWDYAHGEMNAVVAGEKAQPTLDEFLAGLPSLELAS